MVVLWCRTEELKYMLCWLELFVVYIRYDMIVTMDEQDKPLVWLHGEIKTPPFTSAARLEAGLLLRRLQQGETIGLPHSRPMPGIAPRCHELRIRDETRNWRIVYRIDPDAIVIADVFNKTTRETPDRVIENCRRRLSQYDNDTQEDDNG
jgi:phage-related protein